jgi:hypothetical protein
MGFIYVIISSTFMLIVTQVCTSVQELKNEIWSTFRWDAGLEHYLRTYESIHLYTPRKIH